MTLSIESACEFVAAALGGSADPEKAEGMRRYIKTEMPFYGVQKPGRKPILRELVSRYVPESREEYEELVLALWDFPNREGKYLAQGVSTAHREFMVPDSLALYASNDRRRRLVGFRR